MRTCSIDFETHSECNLIQEGGLRYAQDPTTGVYCMSYKFSDEEVKRTWVPGYDMVFPHTVTDHIAAGGIIEAWNAAFERLIFWYVVCPDYDVIEPGLEQFHCTAARACAHGLPRKLADAIACLDLPAQKHAEGQRLIREYSANNIPWIEISQEDQKLWVTYCEGDVDAEVMVGSVCRQLTDEEWYVYQVNEAMNDNGVPIDLEMARAAYSYADEVRAEVDGKIADLTQGMVVNARKRKTRDAWLLPQLSEDMIDLITKKKEQVDEDTGEVTPRKISFDQDHRDALRVHPDLPENILTWLELLDEAGGATIGKYSAMINREVDGAVTGAFMFNGAGQTGRFSSLGVQWQNLNRDTPKNPEQLIGMLKEGFVLEDVTKTLGRLVRSVIYNPDGLSWFDYSSIEGIMAPFLAASPLGEQKLELYRQGISPYKVNAAKHYRVSYHDVTKEQRQMGKVMELALGFLGGVGAIRAFARNFKIHLTEEVAQDMVDSWRAANPYARDFGNDLDRAALLAVGTPGRTFKAGLVSYTFDGGDWLWCELPSGRYIAYGKPRREMVDTPWGDKRVAVTCLWGAQKPKRGQPWTRRSMHGGLWIENVTQGAAADLLRDAMVKVYDAGLDMRLHVHDEIVVDGYHDKLLGEIMLDVAPWAQAMPLSGDGGSGTRYGK